VTSALSFEGEAVFSWLDNRGGEQGLRLTRTADGETFSPNLTVDPVTCQCCATELLSDSEGKLWLAYRDLEGENLRDISFAMSQDGGRSFPEPRRLAEDGWKLDACPHTGPRLTQRATGEVWAVWFTGAEPAGIYSAQASAPAGEEAGSRRILAPDFDGRVMHPEIAALRDGRLVMVYEERRAGGGGVTLEVRVLNPGAEAWSPAKTLLRGGSYPRIEVAGDGTAVVLFNRTQGEAGSELVVMDLQSLLGAAFGLAA
jgi:hypothetical protein